MTQNVYAVLGDGTAPAKVITEGLRDALKEGDAVAVVWTGKPTAPQVAVLDYLLDNEVQFLMYYNDAASPAPTRAFREAEHGVVQKVKDPFRKALGSVANKGKVLFLWDNDAEDDQVYPVFDNMEPGTLVLSLNDGLSPISTDDDIPEPQEPEVAKDEDEVEDDARFSKLELETMTAAAVKRYGAHIGAKAATKAGIIAELFPAGKEEEPEEDPTDDLDRNDKVDPAGIDYAAVQEATYDDDPDADALALLTKIDAFLTQVFGDKYTRSS